jgi:hypothetical protein
MCPDRLGPEIGWRTDLSKDAVQFMRVGPAWLVEEAEERRCCWYSSLIKTPDRISEGLPRGGLSFCAQRSREASGLPTIGSQCEAFSRVGLNFALLAVELANAPKRDNLGGVHESETK